MTISIVLKAMQIEILSRNLYTSDKFVGLKKANNYSGKLFLTLKMI